MCDFDEYYKNVLEQLTCNATEEYLNNYITYNYSNEEIKVNIPYFKKCMDIGLSPYKALLFFSDYLRGEYPI